MFLKIIIIIIIIKVGNTERVLLYFTVIKYIYECFYIGDE